MVTFEIAMIAEKIKLSHFESFIHCLPHVTNLQCKCMLMKLFASVYINILIEFAPRNIFIEMFSNGFKKKHYIIFPLYNRWFFITIFVSKMSKAKTPIIFERKQNVDVKCQNRVPWLITFNFILTDQYFQEIKESK